MKSVFDRIAAGLADAIAFVEGDTTKGRLAAGKVCPRVGGGQGHSRQDQA